MGVPIISGVPVRLSPMGQPNPLQPGEFQQSAPANQVSFDVLKVAPPSNVYIQRDDVLSVVFNSRTTGDVATISGRFLRVPDGVIVPFAFTLRATSIFATNANVFPLGEGYLLALTASCSLIQQRGGCFVSVGLQRGALSVSPRIGTTQILFADYVTANQPVSWPAGRILNCSEGPGFLTNRNPGNPAAGSDWTSAMIGGARVKVRGCTATLVTSAAVANRQVTFIMTVTGSTITIGALVNIPASQTVRFCLSEGVGPYTGADGTVYLPLPNDTWLLSATGGFGSSTNNIQAADQWTSIQVAVEELIDVQ